MARSRGAHLLARSGSTQSDVARKAGVSTVTAYNWFSGEKKPAETRRPELLKLFGIPVEAWDEPATKTPLRASSSSGPITPVSMVPTGVLEKAQWLEDEVQKLMTEVTRDETSTPLERARILNASAVTLTLLAKLTGQYELGRRLLTLPIWKRVEQALAYGLRGHADAARSVAAELRKLDEEYGGGGAGEQTG